MMKFNSALSHQRGASLIEVLVSVFIFAIGVLGFASLQSRSIQSTFDNGQRDQVVWMSQSLVDRVRVNTPGTTTYASLLSNFDSGDCATPATMCDTATCTSVEMATFDIWDIYCSNIFQSASSINDLNVVLTCTDTDGDDSVCATGANMDLTTTWCARGLESTSDLDSAEDDVCDNTISQMTYSIGFRP